MRLLVLLSVQGPDVREDMDVTRALRLLSTLPAAAPRTSPHFQSELRNHSAFAPRFPLLVREGDVAPLGAIAWMLAVDWCISSRRRKGRRWLCASRGCFVDARCGNAWRPQLWIDELPKRLS